MFPPTEDGIEADPNSIMAQIHPGIAIRSEKLKAES
jgi:hypothetical protein